MSISRYSLLAVAPLLLAATPPRVVTLRAEAPFIDAQVAGRPVRLRVSFDAASPLILTPAAVQRLGLKQAVASTILVGPVRMTGGGAVVPLRVGGGRTRILAIWTDRSPTADGMDVDGVISPMVLPVSAVRLVLDGATSGVRRSMTAAGGSSLGFTLPVGGESILIRLAPERAESIATAAAGTVLARARTGSFDGRTERRLIGFGVDRPVRRLSLVEFWRVAGLTLRHLLVRTGDYPGRGRVDDEVVADTPDEIVVIAGRPSGKPVLRISLGADLLGGCAEIAWDAVRRRLTLDCPIDAGETIR